MYTTVFAVTVSLADPRIWIDTICPTPCLQRRNSLGLTTLYVTSLVIGKSVCPSCQKQRERLEYICTSEIYRGIALLSASTVGSIYDGFYIVFYRVAPRHSRPRKTRKQRGIAAGFARGWTRESGRAPESICAVCRCTLRENKTRKQGKNIFLHTSLTHSNMYSSTWRLQSLTFVSLLN